MKKGTFKPMDFVIIVLVSAIIAFISIAVYARGDRPSIVTIKTDHAETMYPLGQDRTLKVEGPIGTTVIRIKNGQAWVVSSPCRDKLCILKGHLSQNGQWSACMPNRVFLGIEGKDKEALDDLSY